MVLIITALLFFFLLDGVLSRLTLRTRPAGLQS
jgi:hypothetical protein